MSTLRALQVLAASSLIVGAAAAIASQAAEPEHPTVAQSGASDPTHHPAKDHGGTPVTPAKPADVSKALNITAKDCVTLGDWVFQVDTKKCSSGFICGSPTGGGESCITSLN